MINLNKAVVKTHYKIDSINESVNLELAIRLRHLGFLENEALKVLSKTPFTGDSLLIEIRGSQIALTKNEAAIVNLKE